MTPEIKYAMSAYIKAERRLQYYREADSRAKRLKTYEGTSKETLDAIAQAVADRDILFQVAVNMVKELRRGDILAILETGKHRCERKVARAAFSNKISHITGDNACVYVHMPTKIYNVLSSKNIDLKALCVEAIKAKYAEVVG